MRLYCLSDSAVKVNYLSDELVNAIPKFCACVVGFIIFGLESVSIM